MKFTKDDAKKFGWDGLTGWPFNTKEEFENASAAYFEITGEHGRVMSKRSDRIYYVLDGEAEFDVDGVIEQVSAGDTVIVPKMTPYDYKATSDLLKLFLVHTPAYDPGEEVQL